MRETGRTGIQAAIKRVAAEEFGCAVWKLSSPSRRGVPDLLIIAPKGVVIFIEVKTPEGVISMLQAKTLSMLRSMGHHAYVANSPAQARLILDVILN